MTCLSCWLTSSAQYEFNDIWTIDGVDYAFYAGSAVVVNYEGQYLDVPPEVNLYMTNEYDDEQIDRILPVAEIANSAFENSWLVTVDLGKNVDFLRYHSFYNCTDLTDIVCRGGAPPEVNSAFSSDMYSRVTVHVPSQYLSTYKNNIEWKKFTHIVAIDSEWGVDINSTNFPDAIFRNYMLELYPKGYLTHKDMKSRTQLSIQNKNIANLKGIEYFTELERLECWGNKFTSLNLNSNTKLKYVDCAPNSYLTSINVSSCTALETLICYNTEITSLNLNNCSALKFLNCHDTKLTALSVNSKPNLYSINCKNCTSLKDLRCWGNNLTMLDVTGCTELTYLDCAPNRNLTGITGLGDCTKMQKLYCRDCAITNLSAVNNMPDLIYLSCYNNRLSTLTITEKSQLMTVLCNNNSEMTSISIINNPVLTTLNCSNCPALTQATCYSNNLTILNVSGNTALKELRCYYNANLEKINGLADCVELTYLDCEDDAINDLSGLKNLPNLATILARYNQLTSFEVNYKDNLTNIRLQGNTLLTTVSCHNNNLTSLDVRGCTALKTLLCYYNSNLAVITGLADCKAITYLDCEDDAITTLTSVQGMNDLETLLCRHNKLTSLSITGKSKLKMVRAHSNPEMVDFYIYNCPALTDVDVSGCAKLSNLQVYHCGLTDIDVSYCNAMTIFNVCDNNLSELSVTGCNSLNIISCHMNQMSDAAKVDAFISSLPTVESGYIRALNNSGEGNVFTNAQVRAAKLKGWTMQRYNGSSWVAIQVTDLPGDINGDGKLSIEDLTGLIAALMNGTAASNPACDVNGDNEVNIADVTALIAQLMGGN